MNGEFKCLILFEITMEKRKLINRYSLLIFLLNITTYTESE